MDVKEIGTKLVEHCRKGSNLEAIDKFYSKDIVSVEATGSPEMPQETRGVDKVRAKNQWWYDNNEVHESTVEGPFPHKDRFAVIYHYQMTPKTGPMKGKRMKLEEVAVYTVKDGKIVREEFFYDMG